MNADSITQPTRHHLRYPNPVKRLRPFQIPTKEDVLPSLETPSQGVRCPFGNPCCPEIDVSYFNWSSQVSAGNWFTTGASFSRI